jgi:hypothetical protein
LIYGINSYNEKPDNTVRQGINLYISQEAYVKKLLRYKNSGIPIYIDGKKSSTHDLMHMLKVSEYSREYMGDYIADKNLENLEEIRFEKIKIKI